MSAEMLLSHVLQTSRLKLYMDSDRPASEVERAALRDLVERAGAHEPVDYLVGWAPFMAMNFKVSPAVLIPRPSTETLVEHVLQHARRTPGFTNPVIADIGTGSGCIAISLAKNLPNSRVIACDLSSQALAVAAENAKTHGVMDQIDFRQGSLWEPLAGVRAKYIVSNPPYISDAEWSAVEPNVKNYEPVTALRGGADGLDLIRPLLEMATQYLDRPGQLVIEIAASQKNAVLELAHDTTGLTNPRVLADHEGLPRILVADAL